MFLDFLLKTKLSKNKKNRKGTVPTPSLDIAMSSLLVVEYGKSVPNHCDGPPGGGW